MPTTMGTIGMDYAAKIILLAALVETASCTITGLTYMDALNLVPSNPPKGEDPCNPLYWYPRQIPEYCNGPKLDMPPAAPPPPPPPVPMPPPLVPMPPPPLPIPMPMPMPIYIPMPGPPLMPLPMPGPPPMPLPMPGPVPLPVSPFAPGPFPPIMPGIPGEGLNILPFSDAYSDLLEKHKQKMIRRRLQNLLDEYEHYPRRNVRRCRRRHGCRYELRY